MAESVDLTGSPVVDDHCHGFRVDDLLASDADGWEDRLTMMGMCFLSSGQTDERLARQVASLRDETVFALTARRWLAGHFGVEATAEAVSGARAAAFTADPQGYISGLMADQRIEAVIADDGFPQPPVDRAQFERALGVPVHRVARIEPMIVALQQADLGWSDFEARFEGLLDEAAADAHLVGYKSIIAYRTGLDVGDPAAADAAAAYDAWRAAGWPKDRGPGKAVRDYLLRATLRACRRHDRVMHLHVGGGDPDIVLAHVRPTDVYGLLHDHMDQPIVLDPRRVPVARRGRLHRQHPALRVPRRVRVPALGVAGRRPRARDAAGRRSGRQAPLRLRRGVGARGLLGVGAPGARGARARAHVRRGARHAVARGRPQDRARRAGR